MIETYRKWGSVVRYENGITVRVVEAGEAIERDETFEARPLRAQCGAGAPAGEGARATLSIRNLIPASLRIERLIVSHGFAEHEFGDIRWSDESRRVHLSIAGDRHRVLIDRADFDLTGLAQIAEALIHAEEREAPKRVILAPSVAAAVMPHLDDVHQAAGGRDGKGNEIEEGGTAWYRPSYRTRPFRTRMNLRIAPKGKIENAPRAIALTAPPEGRILRVLTDEGSLCTVRVGEILAVAAEATWFPYAAGAWGAEMLL